MNAIETLSSDVALLSNDSLARLALELVKNYPTRAATLTTFLTVYEQDAMRSIEEELGIES